MIKNEHLYYSESGRISVIRQFFSYAFCVLLASILGYVYAGFTVKIPFVYANFLLTFGFGISLGFALRVLTRLTHNRNKRTRIVQGLLVGVLATFFQWTAYILYLTKTEFPPIGMYYSNLDILLHSQAYDFFAIVYKFGSWSIFNTTINGFVLLLIWIGEIGIIMFGILSAVCKTNIYPYSEHNQKWYPKYTLIRDFESISSSIKITESLVSNPLQAIKDMQKGNGLRYSKIYIYYNDKDLDQFLSLEKVYIEKSGSGKKNTENIVSLFKISKPQAEAILANFQHKKERMEII